MTIGNGIKLSTGFDLNSKSPLDNRTLFKTIEERDLLPDINLYEGLVCYVVSTQQNYQYINGQWKAQTSNLSEDINEINNNISNIQISLNNKADLNHTHNEYVTKDEFNSGSSNGGSVDIVDDLTTGGRTKALSAEQGKIVNNILLNTIQEYSDKNISIELPLSKEVDNIKNSLDDITTSLENKANKYHTHEPQINCDMVDNLHFVCLTRAEFNALANKDNNTVYLVKEE